MIKAAKIDTTKNSSRSGPAADHGRRSGGLGFVDNRSKTANLKQLQQIADNNPKAAGLANTMQMAGIDSGALTLSATGATVAKAPTNFSAARFRDAGDSIHQVSVADFPGDAGTIVAGNDSGARIDKQGNFDGAGKSWSNIQVQANRTNGGADYTDLQYPLGTSAAQKGTSLAEVHIDNRIVASDKTDVRNRANRLLKQGLMRSRGDRGTYPRSSYKITD